MIDTSPTMVEAMAELVARWRGVRATCCRRFRSGRELLGAFDRFCASISSVDAAAGRTTWKQFEHWLKDYAYWASRERKQQDHQRALAEAAERVAAERAAPDYMERWEARKARMLAAIESA